MQELRTEPRQQRSQQSVQAILDATERIIHRAGHSSFTASELAHEADMSIGRVYYWFPDIPSVVAALADRSAHRMAEIFGSAITGQEGVTTPLLLRRAMAALCRYVDENPSTVALCLAGNHEGPGRVLFEQMTEQSRTLVGDRVPGISEEEVDFVARTAVGITLGMLHGYIAPGAHKDLIEQEIVYVLSAWLYARYPPPNDFSWREPRRAVRPVRPSRTNFVESEVVYAAMAPEFLTLPED